MTTTKEQMLVYGSAPCLHCGKTLSNFHGAFARCAGGETQYTPTEPKNPTVTEDGEFGGYN